MIYLSFQLETFKLRDISEQEQRDMRRAAADSLLEVTRNHLLALPGRSFYREAATSLERNSTAAEDQVRITKRGMSLQYYGGTVTAGKGRSSKTGKPTKYLSIPANDSIREMPSYYPNLSFIKFDNNLAALVKPLKDGNFEPMFWLKKQVTIKPHKNILPKDEQYNRAANEGAQEYLADLSYMKS